MISAMGTFWRGMAGLSHPVQLWVLALGTINMVGPSLFWDRIEAKATLAALVLAMLIMVWVVKERGFVRLTGLGHLVAWVPLLAWLSVRPGVLDPSTGFGRWTIALFVANGISLVLDAADVVRYARGDRTEMGREPDPNPLAATRS